MTSCHFCAEVAPSNRKNHFTCPFCGRAIANYLPTLEQIRVEAVQIKIEAERGRLRHPERAEHYLPW